MSEQNGNTDLSAEVMDIFGIGGGDEGPAAGATGGELPDFGSASEGGAAAVPPAQAAGGEGGAVSAPASPSPSPNPQEPAPAAPAQPAPATPAEPAPPLPGLTPSPAPAAATPAAPAASPEAMELVSLRAQVAALTAQLNQPKQEGQGQQPQGTASQPAGTGGQEEAPRYDLDIPDQVAQAIFNEDPAIAKKGMVHLVNSLATIIHARAREEFRNEFQQFRTGLQTERATAEQAAEADRLKEEYFTAFPTHRDPVVQQLVAAENYALAQEFPGHPFDERYRAALGARVNQKLQSVAALGGAPAPAPAATPAAPANPVPPKPAPMLPSSRSGAGNIPAFEQQQDEIADVFSFN